MEEIPTRSPGNARVERTTSIGEAALTNIKGWRIMCTIFGIIFLGAIIALVVWALFRVFPDLSRRLFGTFSRVQQGDPAEEILHQRFARGEIGLEQYQQALRLLKR